MPSSNRLSRLAATFLALSGIIIAAPNALAQIGPDEFVTGQASAAWEKWNVAMEALLARNAEGAEAGFGELITLEPTPLRIALLADRAVQWNMNAGGVLLLEQDAEAGALSESGQKVYELLMTGREQLNEADDGWYFASIGRFDIADANFKALLGSDPDPVGLLEFADRVPRRQEILVTLAGNPVLGDSIKKVLGLLQEGERQIKADPTRIRQNIDRLGGPPRAYENGVGMLKDSGEYAIPFIVQALRDSAKKTLTQPILRALPQISRPALNPMVIALRMDDQTTVEYLVRALGQIGYWQSVPYLLKLRDNPQTLDKVRNVVNETLDELSKRGVTIDPSLTTADAFYRLAEAYYEGDDALTADPRLDTANVWYWKDDILANIEVPTPIFNEIMCMRCCEEALLANPDLKPALALWLAADFRREAQLPEGMTDYTRPDNYPTAAYFAQTAGAEYCLMALARAVDGGDAAVALGTIEALRKTAGSASLISDQSGRQPLAEALSFPDRMVRIRAALATANALPTQQFHNSQNLMPVLNEAVMLFGGARFALVIDPSAESGNNAAATLRGLGYSAVVEPGLFAGLERARTELPGLDVILLASDMSNPDLAAGVQQLRQEFRFASIPLVVVAKPAQIKMVEEFVQGDHRLAAVAVDSSDKVLSDAIAAVSKSVGATTITPEVGSVLSLEATMALGLLAMTNNPLFDVADAETALITTLKTDDAVLRRAVAQVLGYIGATAAQEAVARVALNASEAEDMRVTMFAAWAEAAKHHGNLVSDSLVSDLITIAESDPNMTIRTAAAQTLGALNLPGNPASVIIRNQYGG